VKKLSVTHFVCVCVCKVFGMPESVMNMLFHRRLFTTVFFFLTYLNLLLCFASLLVLKMQYETVFIV